LHASKSRLSKDAPTRGQPIGVGDADSSGPKAGDYYHEDIFSTEADPETIPADNEILTAAIGA
jgi:hypothetical protein